ncbi:MAG: PQQ-binding-like beta-propeller repeat protein [Planctomycetes bacterium]|nr:PQQ-binding-like beta-propeller repeat protein [Planctomycetota bacterium]
MLERKESVQGSSRGEFLDEEEGVETRTIRSGRGRLRGREGKARDLEAEVVCCEDGRLGWRVRVPGSRPLATPAVASGRVFLGGGFGSHELHAFDAASGTLAWRLCTKDDGPTAAAIFGDRVVFNTESCTVYVADAATGRVLWESWLGDPLMAQPAVQGSTVFMAHPDEEGVHWLAAFDLESGERLWRTELIADVISAPVVAEGSVYACTVDGTLYRIDRERGERLWSIPHQATSAPWIHRGRIYMSLREEANAEGERLAVEAFSTVCLSDGLRRAARAFSRRKAKYFRREEEEAARSYYARHDAMVGFASAPSSAKLHLAKQNLGAGRVASVWTFQGSRPEVFDDGIFGALDDVVQRVDLETRKPLWRSRLQLEEGGLLGRALSPPALTSSRLYVTSALGDLVVLDRATGDELWAVNVGEPILSQPAAAEGKVFVGTAGGTLYAFETGDPDPAGWPMWGGGPGHNGPEG